MYTVETVLPVSMYPPPPKCLSISTADCNLSPQLWRGGGGFSSCQHTVVTLALCLRTLYSTSICWTRLAFSDQRLKKILSDIRNSDIGF